MTLVIMAAGMGSRFGGLKQIEPVGPNGEFIIDYSIYDALLAGFKKVIFIIKEENYEIFRDTIGKRIEDKIEVEYVFQKNTTLPDGYEVPSDRVKPLGTGHALYCACKSIEGPFAVISSDDFYGRESYKILYDSLTRGEYSVIGYKIGSTLTLNGAVKRGVCFTNGNILTSIVESKVEKVDGIIKAEPLDGSDSFTVEDDNPVSMLMYGIQKDFCNYVEDNMHVFLDNNKDDLSTCEYLLPDALNDFMNKSNNDMLVLKTNSIWKGITYSSDLEEFKEYLNEQIEKGIYPVDLYK